MFWHKRWLLVVLWIAVLAPANALPFSLLIFPDYSSRGLPIYYAAITVLGYWTIRYNRQEQENREQAAFRQEFGHVEAVAKHTGEVGGKVTPEQLHKPHLIDSSLIQNGLGRAPGIPPSLLTLQTGLIQSSLARWSSLGDMLVFVAERPWVFFMIVAGGGSLMLSRILAYFYSPHSIELLSKQTAGIVLLLFMTSMVIGVFKRS